MPAEHPLYSKLARILTLSEAEAAAARAVPVESVPIKAHQSISREGDKPSRSCLVLEGMVCTLHSRPGLGTNVELWLPVVETEVPADPKVTLTTVEQTGTAANGTVLVVDDEELVRATAADMLADLGYVVVEAGSAEDALRLVDGGLAPDLLVTDHLMPGLTGTELVHILRLRSPNLPVLIVSGYADVEGIAPDLPRLTKPFRRTDLAASLMGLVRPMSNLAARKDDV